MSFRARAGKPDRNQTEIISALRAIGCRVLLLSGVGGGCPDLLVGTPPPRRVLVLIEIKDGARRASKLRDNQTLFIETWSNYPVAVVYDISGALSVVRAYASNSEDIQVDTQPPVLESEMRRTKAQKNQTERNG